MTTEQSRRAGRVAGLAGLFGALAVGLLAAAPDRAAVAAARQPALDPPTKGDATLRGYVSCANCHNRDNPMGVDEYVDTKSFEFIRLTESKIWSQYDLHKTAYTNLLTPRSEEAQKNPKTVINSTAERMEKNLIAAGKDRARYGAADYTISKDVQCLACHASTKSEHALTKGAHEKWEVKDFTRGDGVGCEMCHGHGSKYEKAHSTSDESDKGPPDTKRAFAWRELPAATKESYGFVNLRSPAAATARCASCHVGNVDEGRFVTHEMYAAGHPPLPPLDLVAYTREQPRHWGLPKDLPYFDYLTKKHPDKALSVFSIRTGESHVTRRFVESTIAGLRSAVVLSQQLADLGKDGGLDYAAFDCASCHHNLKYPSDRQERGYVGVPGRPLFRPAAFAMAKVVTAHAATMDGGADLKKAHDDLLKAEKALLAAFTVKTYGDAAEIKKAAAGIEAWSNETLKLLGKVKYDDAQTKALLAKLVEATQKPVADPEVAQLLMWGVETLGIDQLKPGEKNSAPAVLAKLDKSLKPYVVTRLREGNSFPYEVTPGEGPALEPVDKRIGGRMKTFNAFESGPFKKAFLDVKPDLPK